MIEFLERSGGKDRLVFFVFFLSIGYPGSNISGVECVVNSKSFPSSVECTRCFQYYGTFNARVFNICGKLPAWEKALIKFFIKLLN